MPSDPTDLDALDYINRLANAAGRNVHELLAEIAKTAEAALRARLADLRARIAKLEVIEAERNVMLEGLERAGWPCRLVELPDDYQKLAAVTLEERARAEIAERALAECRAKIARITTEPYHTVHRDFIKPEYFTPGHALKTKEPRT